MTNGTDNKQINAGIRLAAMLLDHFFMTMVAMVFFIPAIISDLSDAFKVSHGQVSPGFMGGSWGYIGMIGFALYFCKDIFNGRSIAKRILKLQLVDNETGQVASPLKCFVRNIFCVLWPIEVIVALTDTSRRLGDRVAGTKLVKFDPSLEQPGLNIGKLILPVVIAYGMMVLLMQLLPKIEPAKINYIESSYNPAASKELEKLLADSLGTYFTPDIRVYNQIKNEEIKYVSAIFRLNKNYIEDDASYGQLHAITTRLIYSRMPKESFIGQLQYIYKASGQFQGRTVLIGTHLKYKKPG